MRWPGPKLLTSCRKLVNDSVRRGCIRVSRSNSVIGRIEVSGSGFGEVRSSTAAEQNSSVGNYPSRQKRVAKVAFAVTLGNLPES
jgi:hypothetical protein